MLEFGSVFFRALTTLVLVAVIGWSGAASANPRAEQLFDEGRELLEQGNYAAACPKFQESYDLTKGGGGAVLSCAVHQQAR